MKAQEKQHGEKPAIYIVCADEQILRNFGAFWQRTGRMLAAVQAYAGGVCDLDENAPDFLRKVGPLVEKFTVEIILNYPSPGQLEADLKTLTSVQVKK